MSNQIEVKRLSCGVMTCRKTWFMVKQEYTQAFQVENRMLECCPKCYARINKQTCPYREVTQFGRQLPKTLVTIDFSENREDRGAPYLIKTLEYNKRTPQTISRHATEAEAIQALADMIIAEPETYDRVTPYRMQKEASAF